MKKLRVIPALLAVGWLSLAGTSKLLAQTNSTSTAQVESAQDGRQGGTRMGESNAQGHRGGNGSSRDLAGHQHWSYWRRGKRNSTSTLRKWLESAQGLRTRGAAAKTDAMEIELLREIGLATDGGPARTGRTVGAGAAAEAGRSATSRSVPVPRRRPSQGPRRLRILDGIRGARPRVLPSCGARLSPRTAGVRATGRPARRP